MEDMAGRLAEPITVAELARHADLSPSRFAHLFAEQVGVSAMRYLERQRMRLAEQLLDLTPRTVAEIARTVGYDDPLYFSSRFRAHAGMPPSRYRRRGRA
jgi:AraC family transcriptional regulator of arabinose operon